LRYLFFGCISTFYDDYSLVNKDDDKCNDDDDDDDDAEMFVKCETLASQ